MIEFTQAEVEDARQAEIKRILDAHKATIEEIRRRYECELGAREAVHVAFMMEENVDAYLCAHPVVALDREAYGFAHAAATALFNLYQRISTIEESFGTEMQR